MEMAGDIGALLQQFVVVIEDGKARIQEYGSVSGWLDKNSAVLTKYMKSHGLRTV